MLVCPHVTGPKLLTDFDETWCDGCTPKFVKLDFILFSTYFMMIILLISLQDGSVEYGIPSTQLYPIHHLDDQEFFPGDFVIENKEESCMRVYGVVQSVDHAGRTATVKWFKTYTSQEEPW
jgi:ubiquitin-conjugating enzyme E2 O